jgi:hypothetical protein
MYYENLPNSAKPLPPSCKSPGMRDATYHSGRCSEKSSCIFWSVRKIRKNGRAFRDALLENGADLTLA